MKRVFKTLSGMALCMTTMVAMTSCLSDESPYQTGFVFGKPRTVLNMLYANTPTDSIVFYSYGKWSLTRDGGNNGWCKIATTSGLGNTIYSIPLSFEPNTTGQGRGVQLYFSDTDHPGDGSATLVYWQYATRGDGTLGSAADVRTITGSDGSRFEFAYDDLHRPTSLNITDGTPTFSRQLRLTYDDRDSVVTVTDNGKALRGFFGPDYQPLNLIGSGDTIAYYAQYYSNGMPVSTNLAFNLEHHSPNGQLSCYAFKLSGQSLEPDSLHCADSLRIGLRANGLTELQKLKLIYSKADNRCQSIDVNQLVFGAQQCDPYQLLSLFRFTRNTSILSRMECPEVTYDVEATINANKAVTQLTVKRIEPGASPQDVTYTFEY